MTTTYSYVLDTALHFEDRALRAVDDGSDFEAFVYETLAVHRDQALTSSNLHMDEGVMVLLTCLTTLPPNAA